LQLVSIWQVEGTGERSLGGKGLPIGQSGRAGLIEGSTIDEVAFGGEVIVERGVDGGEFLSRLHMPQSEHRPLPPSERQAAVLHLVVDPVANFLPVAVSPFVARRAI
jgi:hypothetical protein